MLLHVLSVLCAFVVFCFADAEPSAASNSSLYYGINGAHTGIDQYGQRPARRDILEMYKNDPKSWALYVQALNLMQNEDESHFLSYFQIAGIHGRPWIPWNGAAQAPNSPTTGYCTHNSVLFLTWHRPYLALYEQILTQYAQSLVQTYDVSVRALYQAAADTLRLVYWDWASIPTMPDIISQPTIPILTGTGVRNVNNPFYSYKFKRFPMDPLLFPADPSVAGDWWLAKYSQTVRGAASIGGPNNFDFVNSYLMNSGLMRNTWLAMVKSTTFNSFSTTATQGSSIEAVHNNVHGAIGANAGHMGFLSYSAFDPIFWLHHANVDRLFAIWEAMNPTNQISPLSEGYGTFAISPGTSLGSQTPLEPFTVTGNGPWYDSSPASRATKNFGYTYPGLNDWNKTIAQQQADAMVLVNKLYNPNNAFSKRASSSSSVSHQTREWFVGLSVSKFDLRGERFLILFYLGAVPSLPKSTDQNCLASFPVFPPPVPPTAAGTLPVVTAWSEYSLDDELQRHGLDGQDVQKTKGYLAKNLQWVVTKFNGTVVDVHNVPSLNITVHDELVTLSANMAVRPVYSNKTLHADVTKGRVGGYS